jgi:ribosomal protein S18 acetylase RimI-like enzyme
MKIHTTFDTGLHDFSVRVLTLEDIGAVQKILDKCQDYMLLVDGHPANPDSVEADFQFVPPGKSPEDKFVFGFYNQQKDLVGMLDGLRCYPDETTWWIGLLLFVPEIRSQGFGQKAVHGFAKFARANGAQAIMLGVVEDNWLAYKFWNKQGFDLVRVTEPRQFGNKTQMVSVMRLDLTETRPAVCVES